jgi:hypothetical protein
MIRLHHDLKWIAGVGDPEGNRAISEGTCEDRGLPGTKLKEALKQQEHQKKTDHIRELLARKYDLPFPQGVSLEQFLKAVKSSTSSKNDPGIPIYVSPLGLQQAGQTLESIVVVEPGMPLAVVLERALNVLNLGYDVHDEFLTIDSRLGVVESKLMRLEEKLDRVVNALENKGSHP